MRARLAKISRWGPWVLAAVWLALGYANLARGAAHPGVAYRTWAFDHHSYSDILAMEGDRYLGGSRPVPYLEDRIEYPVALGLALWVPSWLPGGQLVWFTVTYAFLALCLAVAIAALERVPGASRAWLAATPALAYYAGLNWDLLPIALLLAAAAALARGRAGASGALCALGASAKLWPVALALAGGAALARRRDHGPLLRAGVAFAATALAVNLPFALAAPGNWSWFFRFNRDRGAENSLWEALGVKSAAILNPLTAGIVGAAAIAAVLLAWRCADRTEGGERESRAVRLGTALVLVAWIATNKVWSPQYALYAFAAGALVAGPPAIFAALAAISVLDYHLAFEVRSSRGILWFFDRVYYAEELARAAVYAAFLAWLGREMLRLWRSRTASDASLRAAA